MRSAFAASERCPRHLVLADLFFADRFVVVGCAGQSAGERIEHDLPKADHGGDLAGSYVVDQFTRSIHARVVAEGAMIWG